MYQYEFGFARDTYTATDGLSTGLIDFAYVVRKSACHIIIAEGQLLDQLCKSAGFKLAKGRHWGGTFYEVVFEGTEAKFLAALREVITGLGYQMGKPFEIKP